MTAIGNSSSTRDERLEQRIGVRFNDRALLGRALRHRSAGGLHNERLEFLGDAIIGFHVAESLYRASPHAREGDLTRWRATLVRRESLARLARGLGIGEFVELGAGMLKTGGRDHDSTLADALEALVGAIHLDLGPEACRAWLDDLFAQRLSEVMANPPRKDYKTRLQETLQARAEALPEYRVIEEDGAAHARTFTVKCTLPASGISRVGKAASRRRAEQESARLIIEAMSGE